MQHAEETRALFAMPPNPKFFIGFSGLALWGAQSEALNFFIATRAMPAVGFQNEEFLEHSLNGRFFFPSSSRHEALDHFYFRRQWPLAGKIFPQEPAVRGVFDERKMRGGHRVVPNVVFEIVHSPIGGRLRSCRA